MRAYSPHIVSTEGLVGQTCTSKAEGLSGACLACGGCVAKILFDEIGQRLLSFIDISDKHKPKYNNYFSARRTRAIGGPEADSAKGALHHS